ncbi:MAG: cyclophilin-like fold protein [Kofleriaceae bacterium]
MRVGRRVFEISSADTRAAESFASALPVTLVMADLKGREKFANLDRLLITDATKHDVIECGAVMLYGANTIVVFYKELTSTNRYTRIGRIVDTTALAEALGNDRVEVEFLERD